MDTARCISVLSSCAKVWLQVVAVTAAVAVTPSAMSQAFVLNPVHEELLSIEALLDPLGAFRGDLMAVELSGLTGTLTRAQLDTLIDRAQGFMSVVDSAIERSHAISGVLHTPSGVELTTEQLYRVAAWELRSYAVAWRYNLSQIASSTLASPPKLEWAAMLDRTKAASKVYRILANQQFQIDAITQQLQQVGTE